MDLDKATTAFLACHWENDVVGADGAFAPFFRAEIERRGVIDVAKRVIDAAHSAGAQVVYTRVAFKEGHADLVTNIPLLGVVAQQGSLLDNTPATEIIDELKPEAGDWNLANPKVSAFASSNLDERLRASGIDTVVIFGVATNISVESTGRSAGDLGYRVVVVEDACSAADQATHDATIASFGLLGEVVSADDVIAALA
ncbi:isochorismatase family cysteine hydrolase [Nocardioides stalactiti]|uniref:isochorismatase family cysteine hydrolase n=1 Tax=Nocardioides stalactiti TaxID=2755356 RepID=UPI0016020347|nr:isochorismatase family cysteine hydrolase [Nocardioides stalactiti]